MKYEIEKHFLSTYPHFQIMKFNIIFLDFFYICPPVHIFCKILKGTRKKENMKLQDSFWELSQTKILKVLTLSQWGGGDKNVMVTPLQLPITNTDTDLT